MNNNTGWYEPLDRDRQDAIGVKTDSEVMAPAGTGVKASKARGIWMVILIVILVAALIVLSSVIFSKLSKSSIDLTINNDGDVSSFSFGSGANDDGFGILPFDVPDSGNSSSSEEEYPDSKDDFFSSFFSPAESYDVNIGAGCVVRKDLPDCCTVVGNPAVIVKLNEKKVHIEL